MGRVPRRWLALKVCALRKVKVARLSARWKALLYSCQSILYPFL